MAQTVLNQAHIIPVIYEGGVLKPLRRLRLKNRERIEIAILSGASWARALRDLLRTVHARPSLMAPAEAEAEITRVTRGVRRSQGRRRRS